MLLKQHLLSNPFGNPFNNVKILRKLTSFTYLLPFITYFKLINAIFEVISSSNEFKSSFNCLY